MSEEEKKDEETPDTPDTPETPEPESPEAETPAAEEETPAEEPAAEETPAEEPAAEEPKAEESPAEETPAEPAPEPASTPSAPLPAPAGPNKGILFAGIGGVALLLVLIIICACCLIWNPFSSGGHSAKGEKLGRQVVSAFKSNKPDDLKEKLTKMEWITDHSKKLKYSHLTEKDQMEMHSEEDFSKIKDFQLEMFSKLPSTVKNSEGKDIPIDDANFEKFKKQFEEIQKKLVWEDAKITDVIWDYEDEAGLVKGTVIMRIEIGDKVGLLKLRDVTYSKANKKFGWGGPRTRTYVSWDELEPFKKPGS